MSKLGVFCCCWPALLPSILLRILDNKSAADWACASAEETVEVAVCDDVDEVLFVAFEITDETVGIDFATGELVTDGADCVKDDDEDVLVVATVVTLEELTVCGVVTFDTTLFELVVL